MNCCVDTKTYFFCPKVWTVLIFEVYLKLKQDEIFQKERRIVLTGKSETNYFSSPINGKTAFDRSL